MTKVKSDKGIVFSHCWSQFKTLRNLYFVGHFQGLRDTYDGYRPIYENPRQSFTLDSMQWIPDSRYWIPDSISLELGF